MKHHARLFVAPPLPENVVTQLQTYLPAYHLPGIKPIPPENWHLTFHFIGNVAQNQVPEITARLREILTGAEAFSLKLVRVAPGPNARNPRLIWAQFAENKTFEKLSRSITIGLGAKMEHQHPVAHVTLARFAKDFHPPKLPVSASRENTILNVTEIALYESELGKSQPRYTLLERFAISTENLLF